MVQLQIIRTIATKEYVSALRERVAPVMAVITWVLLALAVFTGFNRYHDSAARKKKAAAMFRQEWEKQEANPHSAAHFGTYLFKPNTALSAYDNGLNTYLGITYRVEAHVQHEVNQAEAESTDSQLRFGALSVAMVFQLLLPLLILMLCYNSVTREREGNTLAMLLVQGISPATLIWGKITGNYAIVLSIVLPAFILMAWPVLYQTGGAARYLLFTLAYLAYFFVFTAAGTLLSALHKSSGASLVSSIGLFFLLAVFIPRISMRLIDAGEPLPSRYELNRSISRGYSKGLDNEGTSAERYSQYLAATLKKYNVDSVNQLPVNFDGLAMQYGEDYNAKVYAKFAGEVEHTIRSQQTKQAWIGFIDPFMAIQQASMGVAGTDYYHHLAFHHQAKDYRDVFIRTLNLQLAQSGSKHLTYDYTVGPSFFKTMKDFSYRPPAVGDAIGWHRYAWLSLAVWCILPLLFVQPVSRSLK